MRISGAVRRGLWLVFAACLASSANASVLVGLLLSPPTTAGVATSNRSGVGTWQLYAIESAGTTDFGISSYSITLTGATAINHRSSNGSETNSDGDTQPWGFSLLRSGTNVNPIVAAQQLPTGDPIAPPLITGFGQTSGTASAKIPAIDPGATGITATSGPSWGNYSSPVLNSLQNSTGHRWLFIAEGLGFAPALTAAAFTVYSNSSGTASVSTPSSFVIFMDDPEPAGVVLLLTGLMLASFSARRQCGRRNG